MIDLDTITCILAIIWFLSFLMLLATLNSGRRFGMKPLIIAFLSTFIQYVLEYYQEIADSFHRNVYFIIPIFVMSILTALVIMAYIYWFSWLCSLVHYEHQGLNSRESSDSE